MTYLAGAFWGANVAYCSVLTLHTFRPTAWSIATFEPMGNHIKLVFPWQLFGCAIVLFFHLSPWHLLRWWIPGVPLSIYLWWIAARRELRKKIDIPHTPSAKMDAMTNELPAGWRD